jgi:hypothetical protein
MQTLFHLCLPLGVNSCSVSTHFHFAAGLQEGERNAREQQPPSLAAQQHSLLSLQLAGRSAK